MKVEERAVGIEYAHVGCRRHFRSRSGLLKFAALAATDRYRFLPNVLQMQRTIDDYSQVPTDARHCRRRLTGGSIGMLIEQRPDAAFGLQDVNRLVDIVFGPHS